MREGGWRTRLEREIETKKISYRQLSLDAGLGPSFVSEMLRGKEPTVANLAKVTDKLGISLAYVLTGLDLTPDQESLLSSYLSLSEDDRKSLIRLIQGFGSKPDGAGTP